MSRRTATPANNSSKAPKRPRISLNIAGSPSTVALSRSPSPTATASFDSFESSCLQGSAGSPAVSLASGTTLEAILAQMQQQEQKIEQLTQLLQQQQQEQQQLQPSELKENKAATSAFILKYYRDHLVPRGITFDLKEILRYKQNAKVRDLLVAAAKKKPFSAGITVSDMRSMVRNKFNYMVRESKGLTATSEESTRRTRVHAKLAMRRNAYNAAPEEFEARFPFGKKILITDWTSEEEDGPEDEHGPTFVVKRPLFRSEEVDEFHAALQKAWRNSLSKKGTINRTRRMVEYIHKEFPTNLDHDEYPSWAFSSSGLGFPVVVSGSSSSAAADLLQSKPPLLKLGFKFRSNKDLLQPLDDGVVWELKDRSDKRVLPNMQTFRTVDTATRSYVDDFAVSSNQFGRNARHV
ncbi:hypothetical protein G6F55_005935 [Rhizopus delemar]|uniref:Uncharacterized protein n=2 Tax=Rhizopus TaxID=4842 RepID=A0A9P6Z8N5_9FUNG|nr:hypothetical protein G6F55_005935 [Rhizopus delemar]KAG1542251.1 hypothetical protein G6F51_007391 [Rhizopus arrhizus]KAG1496274.1 hypothetical protein G6F54_006589 [Rhizopus delemar]KAG1513976.1 hypothetical protein G6F53_004029 [Rhizopus delemar]KAG1526880.1 hypothetical protein G6F52_002039 [Rhizopus delemar]